MNRNILATMLAMGGMLLLHPAGAQDEPAGRQAVEQVSDLSGSGYQTYTVELPRKAWTIDMKLVNAAGEYSEQSITVLDGNTAEAISSRSRGLLQENGTVKMCEDYGFYIWFVPDNELEKWRSTPSSPRYTDLNGLGIHSGTTQDLARHPGGGRPAVEDTARRDLLLEHSQEIRVDELHIFIYAPAYERIDLSVGKIDYRHIINGVFRDDEDVLKAEDIPFELSKIETPSHIADIVFFPQSVDLGFITAEGEMIPDDYWEKAAEEDADAADGGHVEYAGQASIYNQHDVDNAIATTARKQTELPANWWDGLDPSIRPDMQDSTGTWLIDMQLRDDSERVISQSSLQSMPGYPVQLSNARGSGAASEPPYGSLTDYQMLMWVVPDVLNEDFRRLGHLDWPVPNNDRLVVEGEEQWIESSPPELDENGKRELFELALAQAHEIAAEGLHFYIYSPQSRRADIELSWQDSDEGEPVSVANLHVEFE